MLIIGSSFGEALPIIGIEAAINGLPIVATDVGSVHSLVLRQDHICRPCDPEHMANSIRAALPYAINRGKGEDFPDQKNRLNLILDRFDIVKMSKAYCDLYDALFPE
jgi:glycosyltransferase involved in cell wall biosynthesis